MNPDTKRILILIALAFCASTGIMATMLACFNGETAWPLLSFFVTLSPLVPLLCCGLGAAAMDDTPSYLRGGGDDDDAEEMQLSLAAFLFGAFLLSGFACPLILAQARVVSIHITWISCIGSWSTAVVVAVSAIFIMKGA